MSAELSFESDFRNHCECSVFIINSFNCFICCVNKCCYLLNPGLICYNIKIHMFIQLQQAMEMRLLMKAVKVLCNLYPMNAPHPFQAASYERTKKFKCPVHSCGGLAL
jgi:hypothetical protein